MSFRSASATATTEQVEAAKATINLEETVNKFIQQSQINEQSNKKLTYLIVGLSIIQTIPAAEVLFKKIIEIFNTKNFLNL